jgi:uncharacterized Zn finger protein
MNRGWPPRTGSKKPPPSHGIKIKETGATWWGARWVEALDRLGASFQKRLARGKTYARTGRTHDFVAFAGGATARVTGSAASPYVVRITLAKLDDALWTRAIAAMSSEARFAAELLAGAMPRAIDDAFRTAGASLFPTREDDLVTECSCPDWANPCKHVAATLYVLGDAIDKDPFLLFELRGRTRDEVLAVLRKSKVRAAAEELPTTTFAKIGADAWDRLRGPLPDLALTMTPPRDTDRNATLRQLGPIPSWRSTPKIADALAPVVRAASDFAIATANQPEREPKPEP